MLEPRVVPLRALDTDVDLHVTGGAADALAETLRHRWHLCLREASSSGSTEPPVLVRAELTDASAPATNPPAAAPAADPAADPADDPAAATPEAATADDPVVRDSDERRLLQRLTQAVTHAAIGARSGDLLMLHAAALAHPATGATAAFVAPGNTGKTTLCRTVGPTLGYVSDETLGVRRDGTVAPYPKPLSTRRPDWAEVKDEQAPADVGLHGPDPPPWLAGIVLLHRDPGHEGPPSMERLDLLDAVMALVPESSAFMSTERPLAWLADVLDRTGGARRVVYAEARDLAPLATEICGRTSPW